MALNPTSWQTISVGLKRAADPDWMRTSLPSGANAVATTWTVASASAAGIVVGSRLKVDNEIVHVTAVGSDTSITVLRGQEGTTAAGHANNSYVLCFLSRVAGLELGLSAPNAAWPRLTCRGGVRADGSLMSPNVETASSGGNFTYGFRTITATDLGAISVPGSATPTAPTETTDWAKVTLSYASEFDATLSRMTPAMLLETGATSLRLLSGTTTKRVTNGTTITETASQAIVPKWVAYHTASGYQTAQITTTPVDLSGMDQPWVMVWFGSNSHVCETTKPLYQSHMAISSNGLRQRYAYQADMPLLLTFSSSPTSIARDATAASGFDLTLPSGAKKLSILPLYGRLKPVAGTTETWGAALPADVQARIAAWYPRMGYFPSSVTESYGYVAATDTATITEAFTWTTVNAGGIKFAPLPPILGTARDTGLGVTASASVTDGAIPTDYGPIQGIVGVDGYSWSLAGLDDYTAPRPSLGSGSVPPDLQARLDAEVDKLVAQDHWQPWRFATHAPRFGAAEVYWTNAADSLALEAELVPLVSGARQVALKDWLATELDVYPPTTTYDMSASDGAVRGPYGMPSALDIYSRLAYPWRYDTRQWIWAAWGLARYYQVAGVGIPAGLVDALLGILDDDMAERDWASGGWFAGRRNKLSDVENLEREWAGLCGLLWLGGQQAPTTASDLATARCLFAKASVTRVAMAHLPRWRAAQSLITLPTDLGSAQANREWFPATRTTWVGNIDTFDWDAPGDDPSQVVFLDQYRAWLADSIWHNGYAEGGYTNRQPVYRWMTRPLASLLEAACPGEALVYATKYREAQPAWWVPYVGPILGLEQNLQHPMDSYGTFLARGWLEGVPATTLEQEVGYPWLADGADLFTLAKLGETIRAYAGDATGPQITSVADNLATYTGSQLPLYSPLLVTCQVETSAERDVYLPYDAAAPHAADRNGISVDLEVSTDAGFGSYQTVPAAWIEDWDRQTRTYTAPNYDWTYPLGTSKWRAGWMPEAATGTYYYRVRRRDAGGENVTTPVAFTVTTALTGRHGGIRVAAADNRYFEHADGTFFSGIGTSFQPRQSTSDNVVNWHVPHLQQFGANKVRWARIWASTWGIWGDYQPEFSHGRTAVTQFVYTSQLNANPSYPMPSGGPEYAAYASDYNFPIWGFLHWGPSVKRSTTYRVRAEVAITDALNGPLVGGDAWGLCFKYGAPASTFPLQQISYGGQTVWWPVKPGNGSVVGGTFVQGPTAGGTWEVIDFGTFTTGATQDFLGYFYPAVQSVGGPTQPAWLRRVWLQEDLGGGNYGPNLIGVHPSDLHKQINQRFADGFDRMVAAAEAAGVVLKVVMFEKDQYWSGVMAANGNLSQSSWAANRFWGAAGSRNRWYHAAIARYYRARWGYSPAVTWEFVNEGDPTTGTHYTAANAWGGALKAFANARPSTTSTFQSSSSFLIYNNWQLAPNLDYGDAHFYHTPNAGWNVLTTGAPGGNSFQGATAAEYYDQAGVVARSGAAGGADGTRGIGKPLVYGEYGIYTTSANAPTTGTLSTAARATYVHKLLWGHLAAGGLLIHPWHAASEIYDPSDNNPDNLAEYARLGTFLEALPLNRGGYTDAAATSSHASVRAIGQKNAATNRAHVWVDNAGTDPAADNAAHNWRTVQAGLTPTARTATISIPGLGANVSGTLYRYDTATGTEDAGTPITVGADGVLSIAVTSLSTDVAYRFEPLPAPPAPGGAPTDIVAAAGINEITVSWDEPTGWATPITAYEIEITNATLGTVSTQSTPNVLIWPVTGLSSAYAYSFRVRAYSGAVVGGYSVASQEVSPVALGGYLKDEVLNWFKGTDVDAAPATVYWSLHTGDPGKTGASEVSGGSYARVSMATGAGFSAIADGTGTKRRITNAGAITFPVPTGSWGTVTHAGCWDALSGGNFLGGGVLAQSAAITVPQDAPKFNTSQLAVELD